MGYFMGIDLGTSSLKVQIMNEAGMIMGEAGKGYAISVPKYGYAEQNPEEWWDACCGCIQKSLSDSGISPEEIAGVGFSGQMHGLVALDSEGCVIRPAILHCDTRSAQQAERIKALLGEDMIREHLMNPVFPGFLLCSLCWMRQEEPGLYDRISVVLLPKDFLRYRLTGELGSDFSDASATLAFDVGKGEWCKPLLERLGLDESMFPSCHRSAEICGTVTRQAAALTGLREKTPVVFGGGDQIMQNLGNGVIASGDATVTIGTSGQIFIPTRQPVKNPALNTHTFCSLSDSQWFLMGAILSAGVCLKWAGEVLGEGPEGFQNADSLAGRIKPGSEGLLFLPYLCGERTPLMDADIRGAFLGLKLSTGKEQLMRAVMEGVTFALKSCMDTCRQLGAAPDRLIASGGGTNSKVWLQIQADIFGQPLYIPNVTGAAVGAAVAAGIGCHAYRDEGEAREAIVRHVATIEPDEKNVSLYREYYGLFLEATSQNRNILQKMATQVTGHKVSGNMS